jgi:folate-dependent phosphoribosylglycinamide formyltransferase PurN
MRISVLTLRGSRFGLKLLNLLQWQGVAVQQVVTLENVRALRLRWLRGAARRAGWPVVLSHPLWMLRSPFFRQSDEWRGRRLELDYYSLAERVDQAQSPRSEDCLAALRAGRPDLLLLGQSGLVPRTVLEIPRLATLNAHPGVLPNYRGMDPDLWAIYERRFERVGSSLHLVDPGIDTGPVLEVRPYSWRGDESLRSILWDLNETCLDLLAQACRQRWPEYLEQAVPQGAGRYYPLMPSWLAPAVLWNLRRFLASVRAS